MRDVTFYLQPSLQNAYVLICYQDTGNASHSGLGINAMHTVKCLRRAGVRCESAAIRSAQDIADSLLSRQAAPPHLQVPPQSVRKTAVTHVMIEAPFIPTQPLSQLVDRFSEVHFVVRTHSQTVFLGGDLRGTHYLREDLDLQQLKPNFNVAANSRNLSEELRQAYASQCIYLPNLYFLERAFVRHRRRPHADPVLRIACFGAVRPLKNTPGAAMAALLIAQGAGKDLVFTINANRLEGSPPAALQAIQELYDRVPYASLNLVGWLDPPDFRQVVSIQDLCLQPSFSESFNQVTADAIAEGVPSVVGHTIEWSPPSWQCATDDCRDIARVGLQLLADVHAAREGLDALEVFQTMAIRVWLDWLSGQPDMPNHAKRF